MGVLDKCCGSCAHSYAKDMDGYCACGVDNHYTSCDEVCDNHIMRFDGWIEITPDNVEDIEKIDVGRLSYAYQSPKGWVLYQIRMSLDFMAKHGGYYFYVLPELKIE